ncbi:hypothetical protein KAR91_81440 [Candidatus Pacearchaeota archaeon]|nr:hypothetical protein [Candidatus Pacearchaeota archaeon]
MKKVTKKTTSPKRTAKRSNLSAKKADCKELVVSSTCCSSRNYSTCGGTAYTLGFIGALVYYISTATGFWIGVLGFLKAIVWPGFVVFELMRFLGM